MRYLFSIAGIIQEIDNQLYCYDTSYKTYEEALQFDDNTLKLIVALEARYDDKRTWFFVDMNKLLSKYLRFSEYVEFNIHDWNDLIEFFEHLYDHDNGEAFSQYLTKTIVPRYQLYRDNGKERTRITQFKGNLDDSIKIVSFGYSKDLYGSYVNKDFPKVRDIPHRRISMPDLVFSKKDTFDMDFANTIPSIDGVVCYPIYSRETGELYACNGARFLKNTNEDKSLNILLMDFSNLGTLRHYKLSECRPELIIKNGTQIWVYDDPNRIASVALDPDVVFWQQSQFTLKFRLPEGAANGEPILSLAGRIFMKGLDDLSSYLDENGRTVVEFHITSGILENIVAANLQHQNLYFKNTSIFRVVMSYVFGNIFVDQGYEYDAGSDEWIAAQFHMDQVIPFITMIDVKEGLSYGVDKVDPLALLSPGQILFPPFGKGLLMNKATREFVDYVRIPYKNQTLVTCTVQPTLHISTREGANTNNDPMESDPGTLDSIMQFAPKDIEIHYNPIEGKYLAFTREENRIWAESQSAPFERMGGGVRPYTWEQITSGLTGLEKIPEYIPCSKIWVLKKNGVVYAVSDTDSTSFTNLPWSSEEVSLQSENYQSVVNAVKEELVSLLEADGRWNLVDRRNTPVAYTEKTDSQDYQSLQWMLAGETTTHSYGEVLASVKTSQYEKVRKIFNQETKYWEVVDDQTGKVYATSQPLYVVSEDVDESVYTNLNWNKLLPYDDTSLSWIQLWDGDRIVTDSVKMDRMAWREKPKTFESPYYQVPIGELIRDHRNYCLVDIAIEGQQAENPGALPFPDPEPLPEPPGSTLTAEYYPARNDIRIMEGSVPSLTGIRVQPLIANGQYYTTTIVVTGASKCGNIYAKFDGNYELSNQTAVGNSRVWKHVQNAAVTIRYVAKTATIPAHWAICLNNYSYFMSDGVQKGSSPYNASLTWRLR